ncbi:MAG: DUF1552 domain-containing protein [Myxococcota bacterium]
MTDRVRTIGRRRLLQGAGAAGLALPFLQSLQAPERSSAQPSRPPLRLLVVYHGLGTIVDQWRPATVGRDYELSPLLAPLARHRDDMLVLSRIENQMIQRLKRGEMHHTDGAYTLFTSQPMAGMIDSGGRLTGVDTVDGIPPIGPSIDQVLAERVSNGPGLRRSVHLGVGGPFPGEYQTFWRSTGPGTTEWIPNEVDPQTAFDTLFGMVEIEEGRPPTFQERLRARSGSVLDSVRESYRALEQAVPMEDRLVLQNHAQQLRDLEQNLQININYTEGCQRPEINLPGGFEPFADEWALQSSENQFDILTMALACDITRVATLQFTGLHSHRFSDIPNYTIPAPGFSDWHAMVHNDQGASLGDGLFRGFEWFSHRMASLIDRLKAVREGSGSMLDNTIVLWMSEFGDGGGHTVQDLPVVLFGGPIRKGEHIDCSGRSTNELFVALAERFGVTLDGFGLTSFGGDSFYRGPIPIA